MEHCYCEEMKEIEERNTSPDDRFQSPEVDSISPDDSSVVEIESDEAISDYVANLELSEDDPLILLSWSRQGLRRLVAIANGNPNLPPPDILTINNLGNITLQSIMDDITAYILTETNRYFRYKDDSDIVFGPNTFDEYSDVLSHCSLICCDNWIRTIVGIDGTVKIGCFNSIKESTVPLRKRLIIQHNGHVCPLHVYN